MEQSDINKTQILNFSLQILYALVAVQASI